MTAKIVNTILILNLVKSVPWKWLYRFQENYFVVLWSVSNFLKAEDWLNNVRKLQVPEKTIERKYAF